MLFFATALGGVGFYFFRFFATRRLGVEGYGTLASLLAIVALTAFTSTFTTAIVARFSAQFHAAGERGKLRRLSTLVLMVSGAVALLGCLLALVASRRLALFLHGSAAAPVLLTIVLAALSVVLAILRGMLQGTQQFASFSLSQIVEGLGKAALASAALVLGFGIAGAVGGQVAAAVVAVAYTCLVIRRRFSAAPENLGLDLRRILARSAGIASTFFALAMLIEIDLILSKHYLAPHAAGIYSVAVLPGRAVATIMQFLPTLLLPSAAAHAEAGERGHPSLLPIMGFAGGVSLLILLVFYFFPRDIVLLIAGPHYMPAASLVFLAGIAASMFALSSIAVSYRAGFDRFEFAVPLIAVAIGEIIAITRFHQTPREIVFVLVGANAAALAVTLFRINDRGPQPVAIETPL